jgi:hypothetical protein
VRTLVAVATGSGRISIRVLTGLVLGVFLAAYAAVGAVLLPLVAAGLGVAALPRGTRALARRLGAWALGASVVIRSVLVGWLSLGR